MLFKYFRFLIKEYLFTLLSIAFVAAYWISSRRLRFASLSYPLVISCIVVIMIIWNLVFSVKEFLKTYKAEGDEKEKWNCSFALTKKKLGAIGATILCAVLIPILGFCVSMFFYLAGMTFILGGRKPVRTIVFSLVMTTFLYLIFKVWLMIRLPAGFLI